MTDFDPSDHAEMLRKRLREGRDRNAGNLRRSVQAATAMENLTGSAEWDYFLSRVEALKQESEVAVVQASETLHNPSVVDLEIMTIAKIIHASALAAVTAYQQVLAIPNEAIAQGKDAKKALDS